MANDCGLGTHTDKGTVGSADKWLRTADGARRVSSSYLARTSGQHQLIVQDPGSPPPTPGQFDGTEPLRPDQLAATAVGGSTRGRRGRAVRSDQVSERDELVALRHSPHPGDNLAYLVRAEDQRDAYLATDKGRALAATFAQLTAGTGQSRVEMLDPRPGAVNDWLDEPGVTAAGFEVTVAALADRLGSNLDPQHAPGATAGAPAAIQAALTAPLPPPGAVFTTVRADTDALGAMAVCDLRRIDSPVLDDPAFHARVAAIAASDSSRTDPWRPGPVTEHAVGDTAALGSMSSDWKIPVDQRVRNVGLYLATGDFPSRAERIEQITAARGRAAADIERRSAVSVVNGVACATSTDRGATGVCYEHAPIVAVSNPEMMHRSGDEQTTYLKHTLARYNSASVADWENPTADLRDAPSLSWDLESIRAELNAVELARGGSPTWGGTADLLGSPQGVDSKVTVEEFREIVTHHVYRFDPRAPGDASEFSQSLRRQFLPGEGQDAYWDRRRYRDNLARSVERLRRDKDQDVPAGVVDTTGTPLERGMCVTVTDGQYRGLEGIVGTGGYDEDTGEPALVLEPRGRGWPRGTPNPDQPGLDGVRPIPVVGAAQVTHTPDPAETDRLDQLARTRRAAEDAVLGHILDHRRPGAVASVEGLLDQVSGDRPHQDRPSS